MTAHGNNKPWSAERVDDLKRRWAAGQSASEIARAFGRGVTRLAVIGKVHRLGLPGRSDASVPAVGLRAPAVKSDKYAGNGNNARRGRPPKPGPHLKPGAVFGPVATLDPVEAQKRSEAQAAAGKKLLDRFSAPANDDAILLIERSFGQCSWPVGEPDRPANQLCCGQPVPSEPARGVDTYCERHALRAVQRTTLGGKPDVKAYERSLRRFA
ncbi:GcrA family cell cycle regulator [Brevundimonas sp. LjRoot202]|uniref:GcrA family cell cycle regulator n=1 Tax=Brevundimonas sp. LjRoot202 TaxID=3342281 RepID=UPI003ECE8B2B